MKIDNKFILQQQSLKKAFQNDGFLAYQLV